MAQVLQEGVYSAEFLISEGQRNISREAVTILSGADLKPGTVLGQVISATATPAAVAGGTGNGTLTMDATTPVLPGAKEGVYRATCITAAANGGTFRVEDPDGIVLGDIAVGGTFSDDIKFVIADGSADFIVGDAFTITVAVTARKYGALDLASTTGLATAVAVLYHPAKAAAAEVTGVIIARMAEVNAAEIIWPVGINAAQKAQALRQLEARNIIAR
jgi:hypothetical protein